MLISTQPGASNNDVQSVVGTLATAASSGQLLYDLKAAGACTCLLDCPMRPSQSPAAEGSEIRPSFLALIQELAEVWMDKGTGYIHRILGMCWVPAASCLLLGIHNVSTILQDLCNWSCSAFPSTAEWGQWSMMVPKLCLGGCFDHLTPDN